MRLLNIILLSMFVYSCTMTLNDTKNEKFGLTEQERKDFWSERILLQDKANHQAEQKYPTDNDNSIFWNGNTWLEDKYKEMMSANMDYSKSLKLEYETELLKSYSITEAIKDSIVHEGYSSSWKLTDNPY